MEFIDKNLIQTITSLTLDSNTDTAQYLLTRDTTFQYISDGYNNDLTTTSIVFTLDATATVSRLAIMGMNLKGFTIFYDGSTANTLAFTSTSATTTSDWSSNSETSMYLKFTPVTIGSITIDMKTTQSANAEKAIGFLHIANLSLDFERIPSSKDYTPKIIPKQVVHQLSTGKKRLHEIDRSFSSLIKFKYITTSFRDNLYNIWNSQDSFAFSAFGTMTGWDEIFYPVIWPGNFDFHKYSDNASESGFTGSINLEEVEI